MSNILFVNEANFTKGLHRLVKNGGALKFLNNEKTLNIVLRATRDYDTENDVYDVVEVGVSACMFNQTLPDKLVNSFSGGYLDLEMDTFFFSQYENLIHNNAPTEQVLQECNRLYNACICHCGTRLVMDNEMQCIFCDMVDREKKQMCIVCHNNSVDFLMEHLTCCNSYIHGRCKDQWTEKSEIPSCPLCRRVFE